MGQAILYCTGCSVQLRDRDFEKGAAFRSQGFVYCDACAPAEVRAQAQSPPRAPERIGEGTNRIPKATAPPAPAVDPKRAWIAVGVVSLMLVIGILAATMSSSPRRRPDPDPPVAADPAPAPLPAPTPNSQDRPAEEALRKARDFARVHPDDLPGQLSLFDAAVRASANTGYAATAARERDAVQDRQQSQLKARLAQLDTDVRSACEREEFGAALKRIDDAQPPTPLPELQQRARTISDKAAELFAGIRKQAIDARKRGNENEVVQLTQRVDRWAIESHRAELAKALAATAKPKPPTPPTTPKDLDLYRRRWADALGWAAGRDYATALKKIEDAKAGLRDPAVPAEAAADQDLLRLAQQVDEDAIAVLSKSAKGQKLTLSQVTEGGLTAEVGGTVVRADGQELVLANDKGQLNIPLGEVAARSLASIAKSRHEGKGPAVLCLLWGDSEAAKGLVDATSAIPAKYWSHADKLAREPAATESVARRQFYAAERDFLTPAKSASAMEKLASLLKDHAETGFVRRNRALIASRAEGPREYFFVFEDLRAGGSFKAVKGEKDELYWKTASEGDPARLADNFVELAFATSADADFRCWLYVGACCVESATFSTGLFEGPDPPKEYTPIRQTPSMPFRTHASHAGRGRPVLKWGWVQVSLPKFAATGLRKLRIATAQQNFCVGQVIVSASRQNAPAAAEAKDLEKARTEARGGARADPGLIGHWRFFEGAGTVAADSSLSGADATLQNDAGWAPGSTSPWNPPSIKLQGKAWLRLPPRQPLLQNVSACTITAWINPDKIPGDKEQSLVLSISKGNGDTPTLESRATLGISSWGVVEAGGRSTDTEKLQSVKTTEKLTKNGAWVHLAAVIDYASGSIHVYINGNPQPTTGAVKFAAPATANTPSTNAAIGADDDGSRFPFQGRIADLRLYNRALSREDITELATPPGR